MHHCALPTATSRHVAILPLGLLFALVLLSAAPITPPAQAQLYDGPLPDWEGDKWNFILDFETGEYLRPRLPGSGFEFPKVAHADWNADGVFDLVVGYNLRSPDSLRTVVYINQGEIGNPRFTGRDNPQTCFYLETVYPGESSFRLFTGRALPMSMHPHSWTSHIPNVYDFTGDGLFDLLIGEMNYFSRPDNQRQGVWLLVNTGTIGFPEFGICAYLHRPETMSHLPDGPYLAAMELFQNLPGDSTGDHPTVNLVDWDSDGVMDISYAVNWTEIIYGEIDGDGKWKPRVAEWSGENYSREGGEWGGFGRVPDMATVDLDGDGVNELLVGDNQDPGWGGTYGYLNLYVQDPQNPGQYTRDIARMYTQNGPNSIEGMSEGGWWHPKMGVFDWDEDGDTDVLVGWGGGNTQPASQLGERIVLLRSPGGTAGSHPLYEPVNYTSVLMRSMQARRESDHVLIRWEIAPIDWEVSFHVHRQVEGGTRVRISDAPVLLAPLDDGPVRDFVDLEPSELRTDYWLEELDDGQSSWHGPILLEGVTPSGPRMEFAGAHPNPYRPSAGEATIAYSLTKTGPVQIEIYDSRGRRVALLLDESQVAGAQLATWNGRDEKGRPVAPGVYHARLQAEGAVQSRKISVLH